MRHFSNISFKLFSGIDIHEISLTCRLFMLTDKQEVWGNKTVIAISQTESAD